MQEAVGFALDGKVKATIHTTRLDDINRIFEDMKAGQIEGRVDEIELTEWIQKTLITGFRFRAIFRRCRCMPCVSLRGFAATGIASWSC